MFERFLSRLSRSEYKDKFVIKGGMLIAAIAGLDTRSTMNLDTTLKGLPLTEEKNLDAVNTISKINRVMTCPLKQYPSTRFERMIFKAAIMLRINAIYDTIVTPLYQNISIVSVGGLSRLFRCQRVGWPVWMFCGRKEKVGKL